MFGKRIGFCIASIWLLQLSATNAKPSSDGRVVGGQVTTIDHLPYLVQIGVDEKFMCGGSLLTPEFVVSAAHCFVGVKPSQVKIVGGATWLSVPGESRNVAKITLFENFDDRKKDNDVAVLKLTNPFEDTNIGNVTMYTGEIKTGTNVVVSGWGYIHEKDYRPSDQVKTANVAITDKAKCVEEYQKVGYNVTENMFCASNPGTEDACTGDSGGPAVIDGKLAGIISFGYGCARSEYPGIFTDIQQVMDFIKNCLKS